MDWRKLDTNSEAMFSQLMVAQRLPRVGRARRCTRLFHNLSWPPTDEIQNVNIRTFGISRNSMNHFRILPVGCPNCQSTAFSYDGSRLSNYWRVPVAMMTLALVPLPMLRLHLRCDICGHRFTSHAGVREARSQNVPNLQPLFGQQLAYTADSFADLTGVGADRLLALFRVLLCLPGLASAVVVQRCLGGALHSCLAESASGAGGLDVFDAVTVANPLINAV